MATLISGKTQVKINITSDKEGHFLIQGHYMWKL